MRGQEAEVFLENLLDAAANGLNLRGAETGADDEMIGEGPSALEIEHVNIRGFFVAGGLDGESDALRQTFEVQR
jgi:hypothetical protein